MVIVNFKENTVSGWAPYWNVYLTKYVEIYPHTLNYILNYIRLRMTTKDFIKNITIKVLTIWHANTQNWSVNFHRKIALLGDLHTRSNVQDQWRWNENQSWSPEHVFSVVKTFVYMYLRSRGRKFWLTFLNLVQTILSWTSSLTKITK